MPFRPSFIVAAFVLIAAATPSAGLAAGACVGAVEGAGVVLAPQAGGVAALQTDSGKAVYEAAVRRAAQIDAGVAGDCEGLVRAVGAAASASPTVGMARMGGMNEPGIELMDAGLQLMAVDIGIQTAVGTAADPAVQAEVEVVQQAIDADAGFVEVIVNDWVDVLDARLEDLTREYAEADAAIQPLVERLFEDGADNDALVREIRPLLERRIEIGKTIEKYLGGLDELIAAPEDATVEVPDEEPEEQSEAARLIVSVDISGVTLWGDPDDPTASDWRERTYSRSMTATVNFRTRQTHFLDPVADAIDPARNESREIQGGVLSAEQNRVLQDYRAQIAACQGDAFCEGAVKLGNAEAVRLEAEAGSDALSSEQLRALQDYRAQVAACRGDAFCEGAVKLANAEGARLDTRLATPPGPWMGYEIWAAGFDGKCASADATIADRDRGVTTDAVKGRYSFTATEEGRRRVAEDGGDLALMCESMVSVNDVQGTYSIVIALADVVVDSTYSFFSSAGNFDEPRRTELMPFEVDLPSHKVVQFADLPFEGGARSFGGSHSFRDPGTDFLVKIDWRFERP